MSQGPEYRAMLAVDIQGSGGRGTVPQLRIRKILFGALADSFGMSGIDLGACHRDDRGDGARIIVPAAVPKYRLIYPLMNELAAHLRAANDLASSKTVVRVRAALHAGDVHMGQGQGVAGVSLEVLARLLDAGPVREALRQAPPAASVAAIMSQHFYDETVPHGYPGIDATAVRRVRVTEKDYSADAWLYLPGVPAAAIPAAAAAPDTAHEGDEPDTARRVERPAGAAAVNQYSMHNHSSEHGVIYATQGGDINVNAPGAPGKDPEDAH